MPVERCARCGLPQTYPSLQLDGAGVCNICAGHDFQDAAVDWEARLRELDELVAASRDVARYDCVVPFSSGKDSAYVASYLQERYRLRILAARFDNLFLRPRAQAQGLAMLDRLGIDCVTYRPSPRLVSLLMRAGMEARGFACWYCTSAITAWPIRVAMEGGIPLVVGSHAPAEHFAYRGLAASDAPRGVSREWYDITTAGLSPEEVAARLAGAVSPRELVPFTFPSPAELAGSPVRALFLSDHVRWDEAAIASHLEERFGWRGMAVEGLPPEFLHEKVDCYLQGTKEHLRYLQRGYGRTAQVAAREVRRGRMSRARAIELSEREDPRRPGTLDAVLDFMGMDESTFVEYAVEHQAGGWSVDVASRAPGPPLPDAADFPGLAAPGAGG